MRNIYYQPHAEIDTAMIQSLELILGVSLIFFFAYLLVISHPLVEVVLHAVSKAIYDKRRDERLKILMNVTSSNEPTSIIRYTILFAYISLPLFVIFVYTVLSVEFVFNRSLPSPVCFPSPIFGFIITFLLLYVMLLLAHFTIMKYGAIYKLPFLSLVRKDIGQLLEKHSYIQVILAIGSLLYFVTIIALLLDLEYAYTTFSKDFIFTAISVLLIEVIFNNKYDNAIKLIERTLTSSRPGGHGFPPP